MSGECETCHEHTMDCSGHKTIEENILEMFDSATKLIIKDSLSDAEFTLCMNTIMITIEYLESKRCAQPGFTYPAMMERIDL